MCGHRHRAGYTVIDTMMRRKGRGKNESIMLPINLRAPGKGGKH